VNKTTVESTAQDDDFQKVKRRKRHISKDTSQTVKKSTKSVPISTADKRLPKAELANALHLSELITETRRLPEQEALRKSGKLPPTLIASNTNLMRF
jgi:hypothetical protein